MKEEKHAKKTKEALFISWLSLPYREEILPRVWSARKQNLRQVPEGSRPQEEVQKSLEENQGQLCKVPSLLRFVSF